MADFDYVKPVAASRLAGLGVDLKLQGELDMSFRLLCYIIMRCGNESECRFLYREAGEELGKSMGTIKNWSEKLQKLGVIEIARNSGNKGVIATLNEDKIVQHGFARERQQKCKKAKESIECMERFFEVVKQNVGEALQ